MTIEADLFTTLKTLSANRVYPLTFVQPSGALPTWPAIRYEFISDIRANAVCGTGLDDTGAVRVQLDAVDKTFIAMRTLRDSIIAAMRSFSPPAILQDGGGDNYDEPTKTFRARLDYVIYRSSFQGSP